MMGEKIGDETSKMISQRVISVEGGLPTLENSSKGTGTLLGVQYQSQATYTGKLRPDGTLFGEGQGLLMGKGGENATWVGQAVGKVTQNGGVSWRGSFIFQTTHAKWARLNTICVPFEYEIDANGDGKGHMHEWR